MAPRDAYSPTRWFQSRREPCRGAQNLEWTGLTEPRVVQGALACLDDLWWLRPEAVRAHDGGRPSVRYHLMTILRRGSRLG